MLRENNTCLGWTSQTTNFKNKIIKERRHEEYATAIFNNQKVDNLANIRNGLDRRATLKRAQHEKENKNRKMREAEALRKNEMVFFVAIFD